MVRAFSILTLLASTMAVAQPPRPARPTPPTQTQLTRQRQAFRELRRVALPRGIETVAERTLELAALVEAERYTDIARTFPDRVENPSVEWDRDVRLLRVLYVQRKLTKRGGERIIDALAERFTPRGGSDARELKRELGDALFR